MCLKVCPSYLATASFLVYTWWHDALWCVKSFLYRQVVRDRVKNKIKTIHDYLYSASNMKQNMKWQTPQAGPIHTSLQVLVQVTNQPTIHDILIWQVTCGWFIGSDSLAPIYLLLSQQSGGMSAGLVHPWEHQSQLPKLARQLWQPIW